MYVRAISRGDLSVRALQPIHTYIYNTHTVSIYPSVFALHPSLAPVTTSLLETRAAMLTRSPLLDVYRYDVM